MTVENEINYPVYVATVTDRILYPLYGVGQSLLGAYTLVKLMQLASYFFHSKMFVPLLSTFASSVCVTIGITLGSHLILSGISTIQFSFSEMTRFYIEQVPPGLIRNMVDLIQYNKSDS